MPQTPTQRTTLATWPTPLEPAPRLAEAIGLRAENLWLKRDDLTGLAAGGNKIRKLEWTVGAAVAEGADTLVTTGAPQSNHARLTAAAAARLGLAVVLVFPGEASAPVGNLLLDELLGADVVWAGDESLDAVAAETADRCRAMGRRPSIIPFGGSNAVGAHGYRIAAQEIVDDRPDVDHVVCALGSGGTMAGLVAGLGAGRVLGVHTGAVEDPRAQVARLLADMGEATDPSALRIRADQVGEGYEVLTPQAGRALVMAARSEALVLDPAYTARALAGLVAAVHDGSIGRDEDVVFLVSGGLPSLFAHPGVAEVANGVDD
jgi:D-cysteine desulfhydrase